jgi:hypothetical protein
VAVDDGLLEFLFRSQREIVCGSCRVVILAQLVVIVLALVDCHQDFGPVYFSHSLVLKKVRKCVRKTICVLFEHYGVLGLIERIYNYLQLRTGFVLNFRPSGMIFMANTSEATVRIAVAIRALYVPVMHIQNAKGA